MAGVERRKRAKGAKLVAPTETPTMAHEGPGQGSESDHTREHATAVLDQPGHSGSTGKRVHYPVQGGTLYPWVPGQSGNPSGRSAGVRLSTWLQQALGMTMAELQAPAGDDEPAGRVAARRTVLAGTQGDVRAMQELGDRTEGKALQTVATIDLSKGYSVRTDPGKL